MSNNLQKLEITLSRVEDTSRLTGEILTSGIEGRRSYFSRDLPLYQANLDGNPIFSHVRELLATEVIRSITGSAQVEGLHVIADPSFLLPDKQFSREVVLPRIRLIFDLYGGAYNVPVTYQGFEREQRLVHPSDAEPTRFFDEGGQLYEPVYSP